MLQVRAKALDEEKQRNDSSFPDHEGEKVKSFYGEMRDKVVGVHLVAGVSIAAAFLVAFSHVGPASARYNNPLPRS